MAGFEGERIKPKQVFNMPLQDQDIVLEDINDFFLRIIKAADDFFFQQGNALTQSGQRCFEFVGNVPQRLLTACFQLVETLTQPVEAVTDAAQVGVGVGQVVGAAQPVELAAVLQQAQDPVDGERTAFPARGRAWRSKWSWLAAVSKWPCPGCLKRHSQTHAVLLHFGGQGRQFFRRVKQGI